MMALRLVVMAFVLVPALAAADPESARIYGQASVGFGGGSVDGDDQGQGGPEWALAAGYRITGDLWAHGALDWIYGNFPDAGRTVEPHLGLEWRTHGAPSSGGFIGIDIGMLSGSADLEDFGERTISGGFAMPRCGVELGGEHVRFQIAFDYLVGYGHSTFDQQASTGGGNEEHLRYSGLMRGGNILLGLIVR